LIKNHEFIEFLFDLNIKTDAGDPSLKLRMTGLCGITEGVITSASEGSPRYS